MSYYLNDVEQLRSASASLVYCQADFNNHAAKLADVVCALKLQMDCDVLTRLVALDNRIRLLESQLPTEGGSSAHSLEMSSPPTNIIPLH